jgi:hypothetical protein
MSSKHIQDLFIKQVGGFHITKFKKDKLQLREEIVT